MSLFGSLFGGKPRPGTDAESPRGAPFLAGLASYPPWQLPFPGPSSALGDEQLEANLAWFLDSRPTRLAAVQALLEDCGVDPAPLLDPSGDAAGMMAVIQSALERELPERADLPQTRDPAGDFRAHQPIGERIFHAFGADLGTLIGEAVALRRSGTRWVIATGPEAIGTPWHRSIALSEARTDRHRADTFDMLGATIESLYELRRDGPVLRPDLAELITAHS